MRRLAATFTLAVALPVTFGGCVKESPQGQDRDGAVSRETAKETERVEPEMEMTGATTLQWLGHASFCIRHEGIAIYIDPWKLKEAPRDATLVLVSHGHYDHYSADDIAKVRGSATQLVSTADVVQQEGSGQTILPGMTVELGPVKVEAVPAYNPTKQFHPKANNWIGFIVEIGSTRIYYAGDTDLIDEMGALENIDVALLPVGGTYTMDADQAAQAATQIHPKLAIPYHWGDIVGGRADAEEFAKSCSCPADVLEPGQTVGLGD